MADKPTSTEPFEPVVWNSESTIMLKRFASFGIISESVIAALGDSDKQLVDIILKRVAKSRIKIQSFHDAVTLGSLELVKALVDDIDDVNEKNKDNKWTALEMACKRGDKNIVELLLQRGANANTKFSCQSFSFVQDACWRELLAIANKLGQKWIVEQISSEEESEKRKLATGTISALGYACLSGSYEVAKMLIDHGANVHSTSDNGGSALQFACVKNNERIVQLLLQNGAAADTEFKRESSLDIQITWFIKILYRSATIARRNDIVELILNGEENLDEALSLKKTRFNFIESTSALHYACSQGCYGIAKLLLEHGADVNCKMANGWTALEISLRNWGENKIVELLLRKGADPNTLFHDGASVLQFCCQRRLYKTVELLINFGVNANIALESCEIDNAKLLIINEADMSFAFKNGRHVISITYKRELVIVQLLTQRGADVKATKKEVPLFKLVCGRNKKNVVPLLEINEANTFLHVGLQDCLEYACSMKLYKLVEKLLYYGINPNGSILRFAGWPLLKAVTSNDYRLVELLLNHGADVNHRGLFPRSNPIFVALCSENDEMVKFLLDRGFDINQEDHNGCTIVEEAVARQDDTLAKDLVKRIVKMILADKFVSEKNLKAIKSNEVLHAHQIQYTMEKELASACTE